MAIFEIFYIIENFIILSNLQLGNEIHKTASNSFSLSSKIVFTNIFKYFPPFIPKLKFTRYPL